MSGQQVRVLMCTQCGAPVEASSAGGMLTCDYCGATLHVGAAHTGPIDFGHADLGLSPEQAEAARLQSLRKQAEHYDENGPYTYMYAPDDLEYLAASDETADDFIPMALQAFNAAVQRCEASGGQLEAQRRVYWIARKLKNSWSLRGESLKARAVLETAHSLLTDPGYRQMLTCSLADMARKGGDIAAAENLLSQCDPRPPQIDIDTDYRTSWAMVLLERQRWQDALTVVGERFGQIPYEPSSVFTFNSIRIEAFEQMGRTNEAEAEVGRMLEASREEGFEDDFAQRMYSKHPIWKGAGQAFARWKQKDKQRSWKQSVQDDLSGMGSGGAADAPAPKRPDLWTLLFLMIPLGMMGGGFFEGFTKRTEAQEMATWKAEDGRVIEVGVEAVSGDDDTTYYPEVVYEYTVSGTTYTNDYIGQNVEGYSSSLDAKHDAQVWMDRGDVRVYYDPDDPSQSALDIEPDPLIPLYFVLGGAGVIVLLGMLVFFAVRWIEYQKALRRAAGL